MKHITITVKSELEDIEPYLKDFFTEMKRHDEVTDFSIKTSTFTERPETEQFNNKSISNHEAAEILKLMPKQSEAIKKAIKALEQEPKTKWIPVSERLPNVKVNPVTKDYQEYLCTMDFTEVKDVRLIKFDGKHWVHTGNCMDEYVTAWMERPEPYKE